MSLYLGFSNYNVPLVISVVCMPLLQYYLYFTIKYKCGVYAAIIIMYHWIYLWCACHKEGAAI